MLAPSLSDEELAHLSPERQQQLREIVDLFHVADWFEPPIPDHACGCEQAEVRENPAQWDATVAALDDHLECPFCRGYIGSRDQ